MSRKRSVPKPMGQYVVLCGDTSCGWRTASFDRSNVGTWIAHYEWTFHRGEVAEIRALYSQLGAWAGDAYLPHQGEAPRAYQYRSVGADGGATTHGASLAAFEISCPFHGHHHVRLKDLVIEGARGRVREGPVYLRARSGRPRLDPN